MILISEGKQSLKAKGKQRTCPLCGAGFEYVESDCIAQHHGIGFDEVVCPWCKQTVWVKQEEEEKKNGRRKK